METSAAGSSRLTGFLDRTPGQLRQNLPRGILAVTQIRVEVLEFRAPILGGNAQEIFVGDLFQAHVQLAGFALDQPASNRGGLLPLVQIDPLTNLAARPRRAHKAEPVTTGGVAVLGDNFDDVAIRQGMAQRHHLSVDLGADALVADRGVNGVGEIHRRGATRQRHHLPLRREGVHLVRVEVDLERGEEFRGLAHLARPIDQLPHPDDALIVLVGNLRAVLILISPMRGHALFGDAMHLLRANLHLEWLPGMDDGGVQGLVEVWPGHGDVILESAGHRPPHLMHDSQSGIAATHRIGDDAHGQQVIYLIESAFLPLGLQVNGVEPLDAAFDFGRDAVVG